MTDTLKNKQYLFIPLAMNQTLFYEKVAENLVRQGLQVSFICFHERSHHYLKDRGYKCYNPYRAVDYPTWNADSTVEFEKLVQKYTMPSFYHLLTHEQVAYGIPDQKEAILKYIWTIKNLENIFEGHFKNTSTVVIQELGGFASVISGYYVARHYGFDHYFIEPSFFKGRYFLIKNSFGPVSVVQPDSEIQDEVQQIIQKVQQTGEIVIPFKDRAHYLNLFDKVFNLYNFKRFYQKLADKYIHGYFEEFRYIFRFSRRHLMAFINKKKLAPYYQSESTLDEKFIYFPLHVPLDVAITFRSPVFKDQLNLIDLICRSCPLGYKVVFKEHPAMVGVIPADGVIALLKKYNHLRVLHPTINNYKVLRAASSIVTVNSKSGAEAVTLGKPVIVLGDAFYTKSPLVHEERDLSKLSEVIAQSLQKPTLNQTDILKYFTAVWKKSEPGDLYQMDSVTTEKFAKHFSQL